MKYDLQRELFKYFGSSTYKHKHLTDEMKRTLVNEALKNGSQQDFFNKLLKNYRDIKVSKRMNEPDAFKIIGYNVGTNDNLEPIYRWMVQTEVKYSSDALTIEEEMLNFVYWLNPKKVKKYGTIN